MALCYSPQSLATENKTSGISSLISHRSSRGFSSPFSRKLSKMKLGQELFFISFLINTCLCFAAAMPMLNSRPTNGKALPEQRREPKVVRSSSRPSNHLSRLIERFFESEKRGNTVIGNHGIVALHDEIESAPFAHHQVTSKRPWTPANFMEYYLHSDSQKKRHSLSYPGNHGLIVLHSYDD